MGLPLLFRPTDVRVRLLEDMGLTSAPFVEANAPSGDAVYYPVSAELVPRLRSDLLVGFFGSEDRAAALRADPAVQQMPAVRTGGIAPIVGRDRVAASSSPSVLSIPWVPGLLPADPRRRRRAEQAGVVRPTQPTRPIRRTRTVPE